MQCVKLVCDCQTKELSNSLIVQANPCCLPVCTSQCHKRRILLPFTLIAKEVHKNAAEGLTSACGVPMSFSSESVRQKTESPKKLHKETQEKANPNGRIYRATSQRLYLHPRRFFLWVPRAVSFLFRQKSVSKLNRNSCLCL